jgi:hypothetical protein
MSTGTQNTAVRKTPIAFLTNKRRSDAVSMMVRMGSTKRLRRECRHARASRMKCTDMRAGIYGNKDTRARSRRRERIANQVLAKSNKEELLDLGLAVNRRLHRNKTRTQTMVNSHSKTGQACNWSHILGIDHVCKECTQTENNLKRVDTGKLTRITSVDRKWGCEMVENFRVLQIVLKYIESSKQVQDEMHTDLTTMWRGSCKELSFILQHTIWSSYVTAQLIEIDDTQLLIFAPLGFVLEQTANGQGLGRKMLDFWAYMLKFLKQDVLTMYPDDATEVLIHRKLYETTVAPALETFEKHLDKTKDLIVMGSSHGGACASIALLKLKMQGFTKLSGFTLGTLQTMSFSGHKWLDDNGVCSLNVINGYSSVRHPHELIIDPAATISLAEKYQFSAPMANIIINTREQKLTQQEVLESAFFSCGECLPSFAGWWGMHNAARILDTNFLKLHTPRKHKIFFQRLEELFACQTCQPGKNNLTKKKNQNDKRTIRRANLKKTSTALPPPHPKTNQEHKHVNG